MAAVVSTDAVKRALSALATRTDTARRPYVAVIEEADAARANLRRAAGFVEAGGLDRLESAIEAADRAGDDAAVDRGREALAAYRSFRRAAAGADEAGETTPDEPGDGDISDPGITKPAGGQETDR